jgi:hypothetical protein
MTERRTPAHEPNVAVERRKKHQTRPSLPGEMRSGWLAFESKTERCRLAPTPDGWSGMSDEQLAELLARAASTGKVRRLIE